MKKAFTEIQFLDRFITVLKQLQAYYSRDYDSSRHVNILLTLCMLQAHRVVSWLVHYYREHCAFRVAALEERFFWTVSADYYCLGRRMMIDVCRF